ncbi:hypothetical protein ACFVT5_42885 [Streptomyces sp. NPDC058001]|uniref:hypothetical protein n=1 Tax=Streptomyces sp. NPDC058001 TaxID=3346300 RepID=UPI0036EA203D
MKPVAIPMSTWCCRAGNRIVHTPRAHPATSRPPRRAEPITTAQPPPGRDTHHSGNTQHLSGRSDRQTRTVACVRELDRLVTELEEAEAARNRLVIAKETVSQVLSGSGDLNDVEVSGGARPIAPEPAAPHSAVPVRREGLDVSVLSPDHQRIMHVLADRERSGDLPATR